MTEVPAAVAAFQQATDAVVVVDVQGVIVVFNKGAEGLFGYSADDIVGEFIEVLLPDGMQWGHQAYRRGYFAEPNEREMDPGLDPHAAVADGTLVPIAVHLEPVRTDGKLFVAAHVSTRDA